MISLIDLDIGNIGSVTKALDLLQADYRLVRSPGALDQGDKILFPGVGNFNAAAAKLAQSGFKAAIRQAVLDRQQPFLGICLGMQLIFNYGREGGDNPGLGLIDGYVAPLDVPADLTVPHMGWNSVTWGATPPRLFQRIEADSCFYFVHGFECHCTDPKAIPAFTDYGKPVLAAIEKDTIYGAQFHPEKSQSVGLQVLSNFIGLC